MRVFLFIDDRTYKRYKDADIRDHHNHPIEVGLNIRPILDQNAQHCILFGGLTPKQHLTTHYLFAPNCT
ncbi:hypothetical protein Anas_01130 [Armadillidium nasatum]|uniref:Uncharacterized protein n=1 Tax=Armadillidium nasatum TaxID=96803 RepID=A0A5N5SXV3_9CRUS|nr:hypothetical protein Anas_01130 [Armadillidium nasatum]